MLPVIVVYEGIDSAGKSSQVSLVSDALRGQGISVLETGVFATKLGQVVRSCFMSERHVSEVSDTAQLFLLGSAMCQVLNEIERSKASIALIDRFVYTTMAYHGFGLGLGCAAVEEVYQPILRRFRPDLVVYLDLPVQEMAARKVASDRIENMDTAFHARVRDGYHEVLRKIGTAISIDACQTKGAILAQTLPLVVASLAKRAMVVQGE